MSTCGRAGKGIDTLGGQACDLASRLLGLNVDAVLEDVNCLKVDLDGARRMLSCPSDEVDRPPIWSAGSIHCEGDKGEGIDSLGSLPTGAQVFRVRETA